MSYAPPPRRSSFGIVLLCLFLFGFAMLVAVVLAGFVVFGFARSERRVQQAVVAQEMARTEAVHARAVAEMERAERQAQELVTQGATEVTTAEAAEAVATDVQMGSHAEADATVTGSDSDKQAIRVAQREVTVSLNAEGRIQVDGSDCELPQLKEVLSQAIAGREEALRLAVKVDRQCIFEKLSAVLAVCRELDVRDVRIAVLEP